MLDLTHTAAPAGTANTRPLPHAVVIGSGFGGLAAAVRLGARGYRVTVLERLDAPGGRASVRRKTASPSTPARPSSPPRSCWKSCGSSLAADSPTSRAAPVSPFYGSASTTARRSTAAAMPPRCARRSRGFSPATSPATSGSCERAKRSVASASSNSATCRSVRWTDMARVVPDLIGRAGYRSVYGLVASFVKRPAAAHRAVSSIRC